MEKETEELAGKWVAIVEEKVVASGDSVKEVVAKANKKGFRSPFVTRMPRKDEKFLIL